MNQPVRAASEAVVLQVDGLKRVPLQEVPFGSGLVKLGGQDQPRAIAVAAAGKRADRIAQRLLTEVVTPWLKGATRLTLALDDTPTRRYGPHVQGAGVHHNQDTPSRLDVSLYESLPRRSPISARGNDHHELQMKQLLRQTAEFLPAPWPLLFQDLFRYVRYSQFRRRRKLHAQVLGRLKSSEIVAQGPFREMRYISASYCSEFLPKLVGTYENETIEAIEQICDADCDLVVDIGAAEGYYAVGMALRNPSAVVIGFEMNASARYYLQRLARLNGVSERIRIRGTCNLESLSNAMDGSRRPALICDCEGAEDFLLLPDQIEPLRRAFVLVETHDGLTTETGVLEGISRRLRERFDPTHFVEVISSRQRSRDDLPPEDQLSAEEAELAMDEGRPEAQWLFMKPRIKDLS